MPDAVFTCSDDDDCACARKVEVKITAANIASEIASKTNVRRTIRISNNPFVSESDRTTPPIVNGNPVFSAPDLSPVFLTTDL